MQLELVLNEEEKKERFKASLFKKKREEASPATYQTRFAEGSSTIGVETNIVVPAYSTSSERLIELSRTTSIPRAMGSSYKNRPTGYLSD